MTQAYKTPAYEIEIEQIVLEVLPVEQKKIPFTLKETNQVEKARLLKKWKKSEGFYYLNPKKFQFSLRDL